MSLRKEFVLQANKEETNMAELCRRYKISRKTGYKWLNRFKKGGAKELADLSRRPHSCQLQVGESIIEKILEVRQKHPRWGARKIRAVLARKGIEFLPANSTLHKVLKRYGCIPEEDATNQHVKRFEHEAPNHLWQMDFKGHFAYEKGRCHPLTILDDHSRFSIKLKACSNERGETVKPALIDAFECYGLPYRINVDNGNPWGSLFDCARYTTLTVWLIRLGITVTHSRPYHPQTNGKDERFHRTLKLELLTNSYFKSLSHIQRKFDEWRNIYNLERPHEGIEMQVPNDRYRPSHRSYPKALPPVEYANDCLLRKVDSRGRIYINNRQIFVGIPFNKELLGVRFQENADIVEIYYCHQKLGKIDLQIIPKKSITNLYSGKVTNLE